jgi:type 1 fimbriae regulatory protein FimB
LSSLFAGDVRAIKRYLATRKDNLPWLFISERQTPLTRHAVNYIVRVAGGAARLGRVWPHMLRHYLPFLTISGEWSGSGELA